MDDQKRDVVPIAEKLGREWQERAERNPLNARADALTAAQLAVECASEIRQLRATADRLAREKLGLLDEQRAERAKYTALVERWRKEQSSYPQDDPYERYQSASVLGCARELEETIWRKA